MEQEALMARAFADAGAEEEFAKAKAEVEAQDAEQFAKSQGAAQNIEMEGWGSWAGIVGMRRQSQRREHQLRNVALRSPSRR